MCNCKHFLGLRIYTMSTGFHGCGVHFTPTARTVTFWKWVITNEVCADEDAPTYE